MFVPIRRRSPLASVEPMQSHIFHRRHFRQGFKRPCSGWKDSFGRMPSGRFGAI